MRPARLAESRRKQLMRAVERDVDSMLENGMLDRERLSGDG